jgi:hypothetical protein
MLTFIAVALIVVGLFSLGAKDLMWELIAQGGPLQGLPAERGPAWERMMNLSGVLAVLLGLGFWWYA